MYYIRRILNRNVIYINVFLLDVINQNLFNPLPFEGKNGEPVVIHPKDFYKMQQLYQINRFNLMASDKIPLNRSLPDVRKKK